MDASESHKPTSEVLIDLVRAHPHERISIQDIIDALGERTYGFLLLIFGIGCAVAPPGVATITSVPLLFFGLQMAAGLAKPWLPASIAKRTMASADLEKTFQRGAPIMRFFERFCRERLTFLIGGVAERLLGLLVFILAIVIALPGPGTNAPPGIAIAFMSIAIINRDGLLLLVGILGSMLALYVGFLGLMLVFDYALPWAVEQARMMWP